MKRRNNKKFIRLLVCCLENGNLCTILEKDYKNVDLKWCKIRDSIKDLELKGYIFVEKDFTIYLTNLSKEFLLKIGLKRFKDRDTIEKIRALDTFREMYKKASERKFFNT